MLKVILLRGLPASGKSTFAKDLVSKDNSYVRVNKDDIRSMISLPWSKESEKLVIDIRDESIKSALARGKNVIVDDTNFHPKHIERVIEIANELSVKFEIKDFDTPIWTCLERDDLRSNPVGAKVIWGMYRSYIAPKINEERIKIAEKALNSKRKAILCDIDGTIAHFNGREPFDYSKVKEDHCDTVVKDIVQKYAKDGFNVIIVSGREDSCRKDTEEWLLRNNIPYNILLMRKAGDSRSDDIVKAEIYRNGIESGYDVFMVLDDRNRVVNTWRALGLKCLQCEYGNF